ncbi:pilus assembly FimT family protein [Aerolutibacter ruishenii]|uniref:Prepilin-type N-terminal cleavage/methylation domain-containing protein n=1 Tax=Aerolutibacter ruishenii TaxID=686800 RepID=A0A562M379_9GAMM|nr:type II secretion system protein [Lysobacter ruishenii]TWI14272.1 prepilin-type N-terminal cleavage/methylation domain-containing protein [Lysobacter ruishenii]
MTPLRGYTLLEMVVVMALLALATAMVAPSSYRMIRTWREADKVERVLRDLATLPVTARAKGREWRLKPDDAQELSKAIAMPEGWRLNLDTPLVVRANGACNGASGTLQTGYQTLPFKLEAPFCRVRLLPAGTK